jgi:hypothetical protein
MDVSHFEVPQEFVSDYLQASLVRELSRDVERGDHRLKNSR